MRKINFSSQETMNLKTKIFIGFFIFFLFLYALNKFFDNYRFNFNFIEIKIKPFIEKRIKNKSNRVYVKNNKIAGGITPTPTSTPIIAPFKKYLSKEGLELREKILKYLKTKLNDENEIIAFDNILKKESGYQANVINEIGAGGLCQAYPYTKMNCKLSVEDWKCQVDWCLDYIKNRYKTPTEAWSFHLINNWF
jgi:hypothetical protein